MDIEEVIELDNYLRCDLHEVYNKELLHANSKEAVGKVLWKTLEKQFSKESLLFLLEKTNHKIDIGDINDDSAISLAIFYFAGYKILPMQMYAILKSLFRSLIRTKLQIDKKYYTEITRINDELYQTHEQIKQIKKQANRSFLADISSQEQQLIHLSSHCNELRTRKETLQFSYSYVEKQILQYLGITSYAEVIETKIEMLALKFSRNPGEEEQLFGDMNYTLDILEHEIDNPYYNFFVVKEYPIYSKAEQLYRKKCLIAKEEDASEACDSYIADIPSISELTLLKQTDSNRYRNKLEEMITQYDLLKSTRCLIEKTVCFRDRKDILDKIIVLYEHEEYELFNNLVPIQIEGLFADYVWDATLFAKFSRMQLFETMVLKEKIQYLVDNSDSLYPEAEEYFAFYFNNLIRNRIAHGRYKRTDDNPVLDEVYAKELLLDLHYLLFLSSRLVETEKMHRFIHRYFELYDNNRFESENSVYQSLLNDLLGEKIVVDYDSINEFRPIQVVYWILNPYYEKMYKRVDSIEELLRLRKMLLSTDFWTFVKGRIDKSTVDELKYHFDEEFKSIVKGLLGCIQDNDLKKILIEINKSLAC